MEGKVNMPFDRDALEQALSRVADAKLASKERAKALADARKDVIDNLQIHKDVWSFLERMQSVSPDKRCDMTRSLPALDLFREQWDKEAEDILTERQNEVDA